jgi:hypothetical protein
MMKPISTIKRIGALLLCAGTAQAVTPFSDSFSSATNTTRWAVSNFGSGMISTSAGKLMFTVPRNPTRDDFATFTLRGIQPTVNEDWEVTINVSNTTAKGQNSAPGLWIQNAADRNDAVFIEFYNRSATASKVNSTFMTDESDSATMDISNSVAGTKASLRATYRKATKIITLWYRISPTAAWSKLSNFSPFNSTTAQRRGNWQMNPNTGKFKVVIYGYSAGNIIAAGGITLDNFSIR